MRTPKGDTRGGGGVNESIRMAIAEAGRTGEVRPYGTVSGELHALEKVIARLRKQHGPEVDLQFCYS